MMGVEATSGAQTTRAITTTSFPPGTTSLSQASPRSRARKPSETAADALTPSVHPIDTLAKKLRQQAQELMSVYEQLEKKSQEVADRDAQLQDLRFQLERLKGARSTRATSAMNSTTVTHAVRGSKRMSSSSFANTSLSGSNATGSGGSRASIKPTAADRTARKSEIEALQQRVCELEQERNHFESSTQQVEDAIAALKQQQRRVASTGGNTDADPGQAATDAMQEQQLYIRVLEDAVHLKAFELRITGHEELLVVLAELRHTIFQQELDVVDRQRHVERLQRELDEQTGKHVALEQQLDAKSTKRELEIHELRQEKASLAAQLAQTQRQCEREHEQRVRLQASAEADSERLARVSEQLSSAAQLKTVVDAKCAKLTRTLAEVKAGADRVASTRDHETEAARRLREDFTRQAAQLVEAKTLQDELLRSIDSYASKAECAGQESERLERQLQAAHSESRNSLEALEQAEVEHLRQTEHHQTSLKAAESKLSEAREELDAARAVVATLETQLHDERSQAAFAIEEQAAALQTGQRAMEKSEQQRREMREGWRELNAALAAALDLMRQDLRPCASPCGGADERTDSSGESEMAEQLVLCARSLALLLQSVRSGSSDISTTVAATDESHTDPSDDLTCPYLRFLPSLPDFLDRLHRVTAASVTEREMVWSSWQRERLDLQTACDELDATARVCHEEMQQVHDEHAAAQEQLAEVRKRVDSLLQRTRWFAEWLSD